jgi:hypothetical protein
MEEDNLVDELKYSAPLEKSDHVILKWNSALRTGNINSEQVKLNYWKGNYREINAALEKIDWTQMFEGRLVEEMWTLFKRAVLEQVALHVPVKEQRRKKKGKWLSRETIKRMEQRDIAWRKYRKYSSGKNYEEYRKIRNDVNRLVRKDEDMDRKQIWQNFKGKPKSFYGYMRSIQTVKENVTVLKKDDREMTSTDQEATDLLGRYFEDVFTKESCVDMPKSEGGGPQWKDEDADFSMEAVQRKLQKLSPGISHLGRMEYIRCCSRNALQWSRLHCQLSIQSHMQLENCQQNGRPQMWHQSSRKDPKQTGLTTDLCRSRLCHVKSWNHL